jgi:ribose/xylose/arabinose/galactoside ABC-type transport system permease subunit
MATASQESDRRALADGLSAPWLRTAARFLRPIVGVYLALLVLVAICAIVEPSVVSGSGIDLLLRQIAPLGMLAIGQTLVMLTGGIDLSQGSMVAVTNWVSIQLLAGSDSGNVRAILICLALGVAVGLVNGIGITIFGVPPFVMTLGMLFTVLAAGQIHTNGILSGSASPWLLRISQGSTWIIPTAFLIVVVTALAAQISLYVTPYGRRVLASGANARAAHLAGIRVRNVIIATYIISAVAAVIGGLLWTGYVEGGSNSAGQGFELQAIAAAVIGGAALTGGRGNVIATVGGVLFLGLLFNLLVVLDVAEPVRIILQGAAIVIAAAIYSRALDRR